MLEDNSYEVERMYSLSIYIPIFNSIEKRLMPLSGFGDIFKRMICVTVKAK
jgi:hypothetical protein